MNDLDQFPAPDDLEERRIAKRIRKHSFAGGTLNRQNKLTPHQIKTMNKPMHGKKNK